MTSTGLADFVRRTLIVLLLATLALVVWRISYALLLGFGGVLFAIFLRGLAGKVRGWTRLSMSWSLALVGVVLVVLAVLAAVLAGPSLASQMGDLGETLQQSIDKMRGWLEKQPWGKELVGGLSEGSGGGGSSAVVRAAAMVASSAADALLALVLVVFAGIYLAATPRSYLEGAVRLLPRARQARGRQLLEATGNALWLWMLGRAVVMMAVFVLTTLGLALVGVPLAPLLGLIAGLLEFVPFLGAFVAAVPIVLVALAEDIQTALYAAALMLLIQQTEGHILEPLVERKAVSLPPALVLVGAIAFTLLFGVLGAVFATPLLVVALVTVEMLYMADTLGEHPNVPGTGRQ